ncbi:DnaJ domain-containing protein [Cantharellus anzutake]|uniref:DnaJ domain-containing protein n=1 Tax=Cantharellus anzutake TaxID=1750568 RepID=UPI00190494E7|nr:DnaJ domain-containing protein [Cantharellus anzutake]KAF8328108.1 DnaJ domain-containing protein [Cantharellus anzutake]
MSNPDPLSAYDILGVAEDVSEGDLKRAYRRQSLKYHPDRHPDDPEAGQKFHELTTAYELLQDPVKRQALDESLRISKSRRARLASHDSKRKILQEELEAGERAAKKFRAGDVERAAAASEKLAKAKEESKRLLEERMKKLQSHAPQSRADSRSSATEPVATDTPLRIRYNASKFPTLVDSSSISAFFSSFGEIKSDLIVLTRKKRKNSGGGDDVITALIPFISSIDALNVVSSASQDRFKGMHISLLSKGAGTSAEG